MSVEEKMLQRFAFQKKVQVICVTWVGGICLICIHEPKGVQQLRASADISGKSRLHMLH